MSEISSIMKVPEIAITKNEMMRRQGRESIRALVRHGRCAVRTSSLWIHAPGRWIDSVSWNRVFRSSGLGNLLLRFVSSWARSWDRGSQHDGDQIGTLISAKSRVRLPFAVANSQSYGSSSLVLVIKLQPRKKNACQISRRLG